MSKITDDGLTRSRSGTGCFYSCTHMATVGVRWLMSTSEGLGVHGHTTRWTSPVSTVSRFRLVSGRLRATCNGDQRGLPPYMPLRLGKNFTLRFLDLKQCTIHDHATIMLTHHGFVESQINFFYFHIGKLSSRISTSKIGTNVKPCLIKSSK